ncbi:hypothetical protein QQS21_003374 [Conoideocrella luteorostrata]|uniref:Ankyrin repeat protein n=1 Tax=Conoideocrella luteorostrata TaxID=1105319 RepID=A0AAJ0CUB0_9HYPO|nr:hypothetical protein QQS21_003374 [Conoideocrella luteorostrata]
MTWNPNLTGHFTSLTDFVFGPGYNALNYLCMNAENGTQPDVVAYLLSQGVDINSRNHGGDTCLHTFVKNLRCYIQRESDVLHLLVRNGAEIHALNSYGCSVSFCAYYKEFACFEGLGSYRGDLWDAVIQKYGCNLVKHRAHQPRRAIYTEKYTRSHFEALWKGAEHLCPYWDDKPWPLHVCVACGLEEDSSDGESYVRAGKVHGKSRAKDEHFTDEGSYADDEQSSIDDGESFTNDSRTDGDEI